jgi:6-phosphogluconate dehydrogenase
MSQGSNGDGRGEVAVLGLGVMGANLARNLARAGHRVVVWNRHAKSARALAHAHPEARLSVAESLRELVAGLARPRRLLLLVPAGAPVDEMLEDLEPLLEADDVVLDGGNSHFADTDRRMARAASRPWTFLGMGISGGAEGALHGPSLMPGGPHEAWPRLRPLLESIAARSDAGPCVAWCGAGSAGHFVKMVHNGIEYADMQGIAEAVLLLRRGLGMEPAQVAATLQTWNAGELESFLLEITAGIYRTPDPERPGRLLLDAIDDRAGQKGTGRWTVQSALDLGVAVPTLAAAVDARILSSDPALRERAEAAFALEGSAPLEGVGADAVRAALYASRIASHAQGFALLQAADRTYGYGTSPAEVARIWRAGCILRARLLDPLREALAARPRDLLLFAPDLQEAVRTRLGAWRAVVASAARAGLPTPALAASLGWLATLSTPRAGAQLIQAQRDWFGGHGYARVGDPDTRLHTDWGAADPGPGDGG